MAFSFIYVSLARERNSITPWARAAYKLKPNLVSESGRGRERDDHRQGKTAQRV
jgi:hypothetical protein